MVSATWSRIEGLPVGNVRYASQATKFAEISHLHSLHNSVSRICQLPSEIISIIFFYLQTGVGQNADLIAASHVCKHWRAVAIGNPCLWSSFAVHHPDGVQQLLMHSKSTLLPLSQTRFVCFAAAEHLNKAAHDRIRSLHITMPIPTKIAAVLYPYYICSALLRLLTPRSCTSRTRLGYARQTTTTTLPMPCTSRARPLVAKCRRCVSSCYTTSHLES